MTAEELIDLYLDERVVKGDSLSGKEVARLKAKQHIFINGKHAVVIDVKVDGNNAELIYVKGRKAFGKEQYLDVEIPSSKTPVQAAKEVDEATPGMRNAYNRMDSVKVCPECGMKVPKYPGRYPHDCPECGAELEDLQNAPVYSEQYEDDDFDDELDDLDRIRQQKKDREARLAQMRRVPQDRISLGGPQFYDLGYGS